MDKQYSQFNLFDWNDERWQAYLSGIYPPPNYRQLLKFRKKWYKRTIDPEFDVDYEPVTAPSRGTSSGGGDGGPARPNTRSDDVWANTKYIWKVNCFLSYLWSLAYVVSSAFQLVSVRLALVILSASVALELLARHGIQCRRDYLAGGLRTLLREDVGPVPLFALAALAPGLQGPRADRALGGPGRRPLCSGYSRFRNKREGVWTLQDKPFQTPPRGREGGPVAGSASLWPAHHAVPGWTFVVHSRRRRRHHAHHATTP
ncbi:unnamed protein product [Prorocentrum cordatum]|uniref:PRA1 family protein n=1 Tax=Prorocentrum cordatum TaxID=2364126 RepID=A0ABN9XBI8_9DINO|nr:unnamed protein product [Polarella glacialis]